MREVSGAERDRHSIVLRASAGTHHQNIYLAGRCPSYFALLQSIAQEQGKTNLLAENQDQIHV